MTTAGEWLHRRIASAPARLREEMLGAVPAGDIPIPEALAEGALVLYRTVLRGSGKREDALPLLAADALLTHAFQAQAELEPEELEAFASRWSGRGRLAEEAP